jgi:hypothetical protein
MIISRMPLTVPDFDLLNLVNEHAAPLTSRWQTFRALTCERHLHAPPQLNTKRLCQVPIQTVSAKKI